MSTKLRQLKCKPLAKIVEWMHPKWGRQNQTVWLCIVIVFLLCLGLQSPERMCAVCVIDEKWKVKISTDFHFGCEKWFCKVQTMCVGNISAKPILSANLFFSGIWDNFSICYMCVFDIYTSPLLLLLMNNNFYVYTKRNKLSNSGKHTRKLESNVSNEMK